MIISTSDTDAFVDVSVDLNIVWPVKFCGSPSPIKSATTTSLRMNSASDGLIKLPSRSIILESTPYNTLKNIIIDSSTPFDW